MGGFAAFRFSITIPGLHLSIFITNALLVMAAVAIAKIPGKHSRRWHVQMRIWMNLLDLRSCLNDSGWN